MDAPGPAPVHVVLSCAVSVDGYLDDAARDRLLLSDEADFDRVDELRATCDAILVGAGTVRADDPRLEVRSPERRRARRERGLPETPVKVTLTAGGDLDPAARIFAGGSTVVYCATPAVAQLRRRLAADTGPAEDPGPAGLAAGAGAPGPAEGTGPAGRAVAAGLAEGTGPAGAAVPGGVTVVDAGDPPDLRTLLGDLAGRGVRRLMVEGGGCVLTAFLAAGLADELHLAVAPLFVGDPAAPRAVRPGRFPHDARHRMRLADVRAVGDMAVLRYLLDRIPGPDPEPEPDA